MFVTTPEIVWHNKDPVFSLDFHRNGGICRLASAGADFSVKLWRVMDRDEKIQVVFVASLERHSKSVNAIRFSPDGKLLASAGDDCVICVWKQSNGLDNGLSLESPGVEGYRENWTVIKMLRGHIEDVYDLCWSSDSNQLISGSVDNSAIVWNVITGDKLSILKESHHYIQGVAWAPHGGCLATLGTDRTLRIYNDKLKCTHSITKWSMSDEDQPKRLFHDETMSSFFRRLSFSPDGLLLVAPGGTVDGVDVTWIFTTTNLPKPVMYLGGCTKPSIVVRFSPLLYHLKTTPTQHDQLFDLPYRMIFAVATTDTVLIYDTQQTTPIAIITDIHYTSLTDLTWSDNGLVLMTSSTDGYCTIIRLTEEEMGVVYKDTPVSLTPPTKTITTPSVQYTPTANPVTTPTNVTTPTTSKTAPRRVNFVTISNNESTD